MPRKLKTILGFYSPSFMRMHIGSDKSLQKIASINDDYTESVYIHEFTHFIQDITTSYGLSNINIIADYMRFVNNYLVRQPLGGFTVPVLPVRSGADNVDVNGKNEDI